ncbi:MAG: arylesterase [Acidobacteria bacterium]|nr:arylesterase [Acidobacteriota bacterium]
MPRPTPPRNKPPYGRPLPPAAIAAGAAVLILIAIWMLRGDSYSDVKNLDSAGSAVIAFGDSLTAGFGAGEGEDYPSRLSARSGVPIVNAGVSGDTTEGALRRIDRDVLSRDPRLVIVGLGGNDFLRGVSLASTEANLRSIVQSIHDGGAMVVLLGFEFPSLSADYDAMYERVAKEEGALLVRGSLKGILTKPDLRSDAIHPNARGYEIMAERIAGPVEGLLEAAGRAVN